MITEIDTQTLEITAQDPESVQNELSAAVIRARDRALSGGRQGILVTQHSFSSYTVAISPDVPYGESRERQKLPDVL
jgi:hypothetical protein